MAPGTEIDASGFATRVRPDTGRAHVEICMFTTPDGATSLNNTSGPLGGPADQAMLRAWRQMCDVIMVGAGTVRTEGYGLPSRHDLNIAVVTATCNVDPTRALFASGRGFLATSLDAPPSPVPTIRSGTGAVDLAGIIDQLDARVIHVEGGPRLNASLLDAGLVDAINLTFSHRLAGRHHSDPVSTATRNSTRFTLVDAARDGDFVLVRYERTR